MKVIIINECPECPFCHSGLYGSAQRCDKVGQLYNVDIAAKRFPRDCPLQDKVESYDRYDSQFN